MWVKKEDETINNLYFDIDGVLNTEKDWNLGVGRLDADAVENFCKLVKLGFTPILTSSWRTGFSAPLDPFNSPQIKNLEQELSKYGIKIAGKVPDVKSKSRDELIDYYQRRHPTNHYLVLDDDENEFETLPNNIYLTDFHTGLTKDDLKILQALTNDWKD